MPNIVCAEPYYASHLHGEHSRTRNEKEKEMKMQISLAITGVPIWYRLRNTVIPTLTSGTSQPWKADTDNGENEKKMQRSLTSTDWCNYSVPAPCNAPSRYVENAAMPKRNETRNSANAMYSSLNLP